MASVEYERALSPKAPAGEYTVAVRGRAMVARTAPGSAVPAKLENLEGATLVVDARFVGRAVEPEAKFLIDICLAHELVENALAGLHHGWDLEAIRQARDPWHRLAVPKHIYSVTPGRLTGVAGDDERQEDRHRQPSCDCAFRDVSYDVSPKVK